MSIYIACFLLGGCSKLGNRYGISETVDNGPSNNIENPDASLSDSTQKLFEAIKHSNLAEVKQLLENDFNDDAFMDLCKKNENGNTCLHIAAGAEDREKPLEAEKIMALLLDKMKPLLLTKEGCKTFVDKMRSGILLYTKFDQRILFAHSRMKENNFWALNRICDNKSKRDNFLKFLKNIEAERCNSDSELIRKNNNEETPICAAIKYASPGVMNKLLIGTHKFIGLNLPKQTGRPLLAIFEDLMDHEKDDKLQYLVDQYSPTIDFQNKHITWCLTGEDGICFLPDKCEACKISQRIQDDYDKFEFPLENNRKFISKDKRVQVVLNAVGITQSQINQFLAGRMNLPPKPVALSEGNSSSGSRGHIAHQ